MCHNISWWTTLHVLQQQNHLCTHFRNFVSSYLKKKTSHLTLQNQLMFCTVTRQTFPNISEHGLLYAVFVLLYHIYMWNSQGRNSHLSSVHKFSGLTYSETDNQDIQSHKLTQCFSCTFTWNGWCWQHLTNLKKGAFHSIWNLMMIK